LDRRRPDFFSAAWKGRDKSIMAMSQSERIRYVQEQATKYISRNKCVDSSLLTMTRQAQASKTRLPQAVAGVADGTEGSTTNSSCPTRVTFRGKGTNMDYTAVLQSQQACAVCPDNAPADTGVIPAITLPTVCINDSVIPFAQRNISTIYPAPYVEPCSVPGFFKYFPPKIYDGPGCTYNRITTPSTN
jgi:hypothetical protein